MKGSRFINLVIILKWKERLKFQVYNIMTTQEFVYNEWKVLLFESPTQNIILEEWFQASNSKKNNLSFSWGLKVRTNVSGD